MWVKSVLVLLVAATNLAACSGDPARGKADASASGAGGSANAGSAGMSGGVAGSGAAGGSDQAEGGGGGCSADDDDCHDCSEDFECGEEQHCEAGTCLPDSCEASASRCEDSGAVVTCDARGAVETVTPCEDGTSCVEADETHACLPELCDAGELTCDAATNRAFQCSSDGSSFELASDCEAEGEICLDGICSPVVCAPSTKFCDGGHIRECNQWGTDMSLAEACDGDEYCDDSSAKCVAMICQPGEVVCEESLLKTCNFLGNGYASVDCAAEGGVCKSGQCVPKVCEPNAYYCSAGNVRRCSADGSASTAADTCLSSEYCEAGLGTCQTDVCMPNASLCDGNEATTCASDGSGPKPNGTDCAINGQACFDGACKPVVCSVGPKFCADDQVQTCADNGTLLVASSCDSEEHCSEISGGADCVDDICEQEESACSGERVATCNSVGSGFASLGEDCSANGGVCDLTLGCVPAASDTIPPDLTSGSGDPTEYGELSGNFYGVEKNRRLTQIKAFIEASGPVTWLVYLVPDPGGPTGYVKLLEHTVPDSGPSGALSSGAIDVLLEAGKVYYIGAVVDGPYVLYSADNLSSEYVHVSFGRLLGGWQEWYAAPPNFSVGSSSWDLDHPQAQELTTTAP